MNEIGSLLVCSVASSSLAFGYGLAATEQQLRGTPYIKNWVLI
jgi:hypothetical protein